jgi:SPW repeat-containing protein
VIASLALWRALGAETASMARLSWVVAAGGFWAMLAPFELGYATMHAPVDNDLIVGLAVVLLGIWRAVSRPKGRSHHRLAHHRTG